MSCSNLIKLWCLHWHSPWASPFRKRCSTLFSTPKESRNVGRPQRKRGSGQTMGLVCGLTALCSAPSGSSSLWGWSRVRIKPSAFLEGPLGECPRQAAVPVSDNGVFGSQPPLASPEHDYWQGLSTPGFLIVDIPFLYFNFFTLHIYTSISQSAFQRTPVLY